MSNLYVIGYDKKPFQIVGTNFSDCCGSTYHPRQLVHFDINTGGRGIALGIDVDMSKATNKPSDKVTISEIKTRNGVITVGIRHAW